MPLPQLTFPLLQFFFNAGGVLRWEPITEASPLGDGTPEQSGYLRSEATLAGDVVTIYEANDDTPATRRFQFIAIVAPAAGRRQHTIFVPSLPAMMQLLPMLAALKQVATPAEI